MSYWNKQETTMYVCVHLCTIRSGSHELVTNHMYLTDTVIPETSLTKIILLLNLTEFVAGWLTCWTVNPVALVQLLNMTGHQAVLQFFQHSRRVISACILWLSCAQQALGSLCKLKSTCPPFHTKWPKDWWHGSRKCIIVAE